MVGSREETFASCDITLREKAAAFWMNLSVLWSRSWALWGAGPFSLAADSTPCVSDPSAGACKHPTVWWILSKRTTHSYPFPSLLSVALARRLRNFLLGQEPFPELLSHNLSLPPITKYHSISLIPWPVDIY